MDRQSGCHLEEEHKGLVNDDKHSADLHNHPRHELGVPAEQLEFAAIVGVVASQTEKQYDVYDNSKDEGTASPDFVVLGMCSNDMVIVCVDFVLGFEFDDEVVLEFEELICLGAAVCAINVAEEGVF